MNPQQTIDALLARMHHPSLKQIQPGLERIQSMLAALGNPQDRLPPVIHVAGTNGKGSLIAYLTAICQAAGLRVHRYISPELIHFNERIHLAGSDISDDALIDVLTRVADRLEEHPVTLFESTTAAAFLAFAQTPADVLLLETGMGGRLDATNLVAKPLATAITPISLDHCEFLGNTVEQIAYEKAGIMKHGVPCIIGPQPAEVEHMLLQQAREKQAPLSLYGRDWWVEGRNYHENGYSLPLRPSLIGDHQRYNAATAIACAKHLSALGITEHHILQGIETAHWPARLHKLPTGMLTRLVPGGEVWLDGGHNASAGAVLAEWAKAQNRKLHLICGMIEGKDSAAFLKALAPYVATCATVEIEGEPKSQKPEALVHVARAVGIQARVSPDIAFALQQVNGHDKAALVLICGSLYLAGRVLKLNQRA